MTALDVCVIALYLAAVLAVNHYWGRRVTFADWLTSKGTIGWGFLIFTVVSTNVGAGTILGTAGSTYHSGIGWGLTSGIGALLGYWLMAGFAVRIRRITPVGERSSFSEFFRRRYSREVQMTVGLIIAFLYFFYLAAQFKGLSGILEVWAGWDTRIAGFTAALLVIWLTANAGIRSDMYTDVLHFWAMFMTIALATGLAIFQMGGFHSLTAILQEKGALDTLVDPYAFGGWSYVWLGIPIGALLGLPSMEVWQRIDAAHGARDARRAFILSGILNALFFGVAILLGFVARAVLEEDIPKNHVLFRLIQHTLPPGLVGLAIAGAFAAFMSTANSMLMVSVSALLGDLLYAKQERLGRQRNILRTTRRLTWLVGAAGLAIAYVRPDIVSLILTGLWGSGVLLPAILGGLFWRRANSKAAMSSILLGFIVTTGLAYAPGWGETFWIPGLTLAAAVFVLTSLATPHSPGENPDLASTPVRQ